MEKISLDSEKNGKFVSTGHRGGLRTMPFIIANEAFERVASVGLHINMIIYLKYEYHLENATVAIILFWWGAISNFLPTFGAFLSDSYMGRFLVIAFGTVVSFAGQVLLLLTALLTVARPPYCKNYPNNCIKPNAGQLAFLFSSFALMSIGAGGIRACSLAFGADQFDNPEKPKNQRVTQSFFNWYYACVSVSVMFAITVVVYIQTDFGWKIGFGVPVGLMFLSTILFFSGSKLYVKLQPDKCLMTGLVQVVLVYWKNKHLSLPPMDSAGECRYHHDKDSKQIFPTKRLRFLNKACIIRNPEKDLNPDGTISDPWKLCTVQQVENLKSLIKVLPIWSTSIMIAVIISQHSFYILQAITMDRSLSGGRNSFKIPPASFSAFGVLALGIWIAIYDRAIVPYLSKYTKNKRGLSFEQRIGTGLFLSCVTTAVAAMVERNRRNTSIRQGLGDNPVGVVNMSAMWLVPQFCLTGLSEAFNAIGQIEYYYAHFPKKMSSIGVALFSLGLAVGNLIGSGIVQIVNHFSGKGRVKWISDNLNQGHYDYYYWVLTILSLVNFLYFILLTFFYDCSEDQNLTSQEQEEEKEQEKEEEIKKEENVDKSSRDL